MEPLTLLIGGVLSALVFDWMMPGEERVKYFDAFMRKLKATLTSTPRMRGKGCFAPESEYPDEMVCLESVPAPDPVPWSHTRITRPWHLEPDNWSVEPVDPKTADAATTTIPVQSAATSTSDAAPAPGNDTATVSASEVGSVSLNGTASTTSSAPSDATMTIVSAVLSGSGLSTALEASSITSPLPSDTRTSPAYVHSVPRSPRSQPPLIGPSTPDDTPRPPLLSPDAFRYILFCVVTAIIIQGWQSFAAQWAMTQPRTPVDVLALLCGISPSRRPRSTSASLLNRQRAGALGRAPAAFFSQFYLRPEPLHSEKDQVAPTTDDIINGIGFMFPTSMPTVEEIGVYLENVCIDTPDLQKAGLLAFPELCPSNSGDALEMINLPGINLGESLLYTAFERTSSSCKEAAEN
ncbi:hypothetical protein PsYK624_167780 [Phanerochaete sordida]|uniref:Uncharacterized protein n=1 Tax=Phanerochaete sordida TaxID=48140 RepID=A0A9P3GRG5_9APHY|nr:hypothetical protein PsYK624_167780 [Phanerochaete sordida]